MTISRPAYIILEKYTQPNMTISRPAYVILEKNTQPSSRDVFMQPFLIFEAQMFSYHNRVLVKKKQSWAQFFTPRESFNLNYSQ